MADDLDRYMAERDRREPGFIALVDDAQNRRDGERNRYCEVLKIDVPCLGRVVGHHDAGNYSLLIVAILEHGSPMTLVEAAERFETAGVGPAAEALGGSR